MARPGTKWALEKREREMEEEKGEGQREVQVSKVKNWKDQRAETLIIRLPISPSLSKRGDEVKKMHNLPQDFIHWTFEGVKGLKWRGKLLTMNTHIHTHKKTWCTQTLELLPEWPIWSRSTHLKRPKMAVLGHTCRELVCVLAFKLSTPEAHYTNFDKIVDLEN